MLRTSGRVVTRETGQGIPNLLTVLWAWRTGRAPASGRLAYKLLLNPEAAVRLGSALTSDSGHFELSLEAADDHPDLVLGIFAPQDRLGSDALPEADERLLLFLSSTPRDNAGAAEAFSVRLPKAIVDERALLTSAIPPEPKPERSDDDIITGLMDGLSRDTEAHRKLREKMKDRLAAQAADEQERAEKARSALWNLARRRSTTLEKTGEDDKTGGEQRATWVPPIANKPKFAQAVAAAHRSAKLRGLERIKEYRTDALLSLDSRTLELWKAAGATMEDGTKGAISVSGPAVAAALTRVSGGTDLMKVRSLVELCCTPEEGEAKAEHAANPHVCGSLAAVSEDQSNTSSLEDDGEDIEDPTSLKAGDLIINRVVGQIQQLRRGVPEVADLVVADTGRINDTLKSTALMGGPADTTAFHDFHVLQLAFEHVWTQAFDENLRSQAIETYKEMTKLYEDARISVPPLAAYEDIDELVRTAAQLGATVGGGRSDDDMTYSLAKTYGGFTLQELEGDEGAVSPKFMYVNAPTTSSRTPEAIALKFVDKLETAFPGVRSIWPALSFHQRNIVSQQYAAWRDATARGDAQAKRDAQRTAELIFTVPTGPAGRLLNLVQDMGRTMAEPYAFDVFARDTYNFGIMVTYRQKWEPGVYQAGNLVSTIPLAPGEKRTYSKKTLVKKSRAQKEIERSMSSHAEQASTIARAEAEIMKRTTTATNFQMSSGGAFNIGLGSFNASSAFSLNQNAFSSETKRSFHEATQKAADEYRKERSLEIDTTESSDAEVASSGEISNPNNEIAVTYLFYELQRRYKVTEHIHRARSVILVAQDVPAPHEINEAWLTGYQWILSRVLLDDSLRPALEYLTSGLAGDEVSAAVIAAAWTKEHELVATLQASVDQQVKDRDALRSAVIGKQQELDSIADMPGALKFFTFGIDPTSAAKDVLEAGVKAAESQLKYADETLSETRSRLRSATDSYAQATKDYAAALQKKFARHVAIDQLRLHVKQNILYYMQAIWDHEPPDQRFFRLHDLEVELNEPAQSCTSVWEPAADATSAVLGGKSLVPLQAPNRSWVISKVSAPSGGKFAIHPASAVRGRVTQTCAPVIGGTTKKLIEIADLDNPLGYKGNYIIFPLKQPCYLTTFMLREYVDEYLGLRDPDSVANLSVEDVAALVTCIRNKSGVDQATKDAARDLLIEKLSEQRHLSDEIIVPTGELFIECLPGTHTLLEPFKLRHREEDVRKVQAEVRHAELENLRLASRLLGAKDNPALLEDPDIEKKVVVEANAMVEASTSQGTPP